jgi:succinate dehydrogenase / fumarate reductase membrane anchor subunit
MGNQMTAQDFKTELKKAKGLGAAHTGAGTWLALRVSAVALIPLTVWLVFAMLHLAGSGYPQVISWIKQPVNTVLLLMLILFAFYHGYLGIREVIEDYVHHVFSKYFLLITLKLFFVMLAIADVFSALFISFRL